MDRLQRLQTVFERTPIYFITTCTHERRKSLANSRVHETVARFAENGPASGAWLGAYIVMQDHLHAFVVFDDMKMSLPTWMKSLKNALSKTLRGCGVVAPHWQKGYFDHVLRSAESYSEKWDYVRNNPVRAGLVNSADAWPYWGEPFPLEYVRDRI